MIKKRQYKDVKIIDKPSILTGDKTLDDFLSNESGFQLGNLIMMTGTSGAGKTTFCKLIQRDVNFPTHFHALESLASSVKRQTDRIKISHSNAYITDEEDYADFNEFMKFLYEDKPKFVMVDSLQHAVKQLKKDGMGETAAYHHVLDSLYSWKDKTQGIVILICQLNKDGSFSGPAGMLFDADAQIHLQFDKKTGERTMETFKNRMGALGSIYYEFTDCDKVIKFYDSEEWEVTKQGITFPDMIVDTVQRFIYAHKKHENYLEFKKEFNRKTKTIYKTSDNDFFICSELIKLVGEMKSKYF